VIVPVLLLGTLALLPSGAAAQSSLPSDPEADSPSGVIYEIPLERARKDAAPRQPGGGASGEDEETSIRSENNFGSSSEVPGVADAETGEADVAAEGEDGSGGGGSNGDDNGRSGKAREDNDGAAEDVARVASASSDGPSEAIVFPLLALLILGGALVGVIATRGRRGYGN
jgi:hypothetical protein